MTDAFDHQNNVTVMKSNQRRNGDTRGIRIPDLLITRFIKSLKSLKISSFSLIILYLMYICLIHF